MREGGKLEEREGEGGTTERHVVDGQAHGREQERGIPSSVSTK